MPQSAKAILHQALELPSNDRAALVEGLAGLDKPDPALDGLWLKEAEDRVAAYRAGKLGRSMRSRSSPTLGKIFEDEIPASSSQRT